MFDFGNKKAKKIKSLEQCKKELEDEIKALELQLDGKIQLLVEREKMLSHTQTTLKNAQEKLEKINQDNGELKSQLAKKTQELETLDRQWSEKENVSKKIKIRLEDTENNLKKKIEQYQKAELQIKSLEGERQALTNEKYILQKEIASTRKDLEDVKKTLDTNTNSLSKTQGKYNEIEKSYENTKKELGDSVEIIKLQEEDIKAKEKQLSQMQKELGEAKELLQKKEARLSEIEKDKKKLEQEVKKLNHLLETLQYESTLARSQIEEEMQEKMFSIIKQELADTKTKLSIGENKLVEASNKDKEMDQHEESKEVLNDPFPMESGREAESVRITPETLRMLLNYPEVREKFAELKNKIEGLMILCEDKEIEEKTIEFFQAIGIARTLELVALFEDGDAIEFLRRYIQSKGEEIRYPQLLVLSIMAYSKADSKQRDLIEKNDLASRSMLKVYNEISKEK